MDLERRPRQRVDQRRMQVVVGDERCDRRDHRDVAVGHAAGEVEDASVERHLAQIGETLAVTVGVNEAEQMDVRHGGEVGEDRIGGGCDRGDDVDLIGTQRVSRSPVGDRHQGDIVSASFG